MQWLKKYSEDDLYGTLIFFFVVCIGIVFVVTSPEQGSRNKVLAWFKPKGIYNMAIKKEDSTHFFQCRAKNSKDCPENMKSIGPANYLVRKIERLRGYDRPPLQVIVPSFEDGYYPSLPSQPDLWHSLQISLPGDQN